MRQKIYDNHRTIGATRRMWCFLFILTGLLTGMANRSYGARQPSPTSFDCKVQPYYKYRKDGKPGREITLKFNGGKLYGPATITVDCNSVKEETKVNETTGVSELSVLLPANAGLDNDCQARISVITPENELYRSVIVPQKRQWTVYIYPHSHVDIGYTNTQQFVKNLHNKDIEVGIELAKKTQNYPEGSRFIWNPEALWVTDNYLKQATPEKKKEFIEAVKKGWICLDGDYDNSNTSACSDEELLNLFHKSHEIQQLTGVPISTMVQFDVPGASWGITQAAFQNGIHTFIEFSNLGTVRKPWENHPFYWVAPDGKTKILFIQAFPYGYGYTVKGSKIGIGRVQGQIPGIDRISTKDPTADFLDPLIFDETAKLEEAGSPYDIFVMPWALADNSYIDTDLPDAVRLWNEKYAYPKLIIAGAKRIAHDFESRYGSIFPEIKGDYSEYWTDGLGSDAKRVGLNRVATENIVQSETAWAMLNHNQPAPRELVNESWRYALLGAEHTWGYSNPAAPMAKGIEQTKASYFENAYKTSNELLKKTFAAVEDPGSNKIAIFNTLSWNRSGLITLSKEQSKAGDRVVDEKGKTVMSQRLSTGELVFWASDIPALGTKTYAIKAGAAKKGRGCRLNGNTISNGIFSVTVDPKSGDISSLTDLKTGHEFVDSKSQYGMNSYLYLLGKDSSDKTQPAYDIVLKIKEKGPLVTTIAVQSKAPGCNWLTREVRVVLNQPWVDLTNSFDKIGTRTKEGIHFSFPFDIANGTTRMDIPWGTMIPEYDQLPGGNRNWLTYLHWVDISNSNAGVTWTSIEAPLIEMGSITANLPGGAHGAANWYKTLPKSQTLFSWALNNHWNTNFPLEQGGLINLHYAIMPHQAYDATAAQHFGLEENRPLLAVPVKEKPATNSWVKIGNPKVLISILKQSDNGKGMVLRLRSMSDKPEKVDLSWTDGKPHKLYSCLADEKPIAEINGDQTILPNGTISYYFEP
ncbi:MAG TPA: glycoside hydrolase family 38 C-terminal domain-containing protein [Mucilaginibacter sp.]|nr:glycoside hydrolase family 38 C-terminal domain-containing protein [Mucilaginibacter sp.]